MIIERTKDEIIIRLAPTIKIDELQELTEFLRFKEITSKYSIEQDIVDQLASDVNKIYWKKNKDSFL